MKQLSKRDFEISKQEYSLEPARLALGLVTPKSKVLSLGCGSGREIQFLSRVLNCNITGVDIDPRCIASSSKMNPKAKHYFSEIYAFAEKDKGKYDYILLLWNVINYLPKTRRVALIAHLFNLLTDKGKIIITTQCKYCSWRKFFKELFQRTGYYFSPSEILLWFKYLNLKIQMIDIYTSVNTHLIVASR